MRVSIVLAIACIACTVPVCTPAFLRALDLHYYADLVAKVSQWVAEVERDKTFKFDAKYMKKNWRIVSGIFASELASALDQSNHLRVLDLSNAQLGTAAVIRILDSLEKHDNLKLLQLAGNRLDCEAASVVARLLTTHPSVKGVWLGNNEISDRGLMLLSEAMLDGGQITLLGLSGNSFAGDGALALASAIKKGTALSSLSLQRAQLTHEGYQALAMAVGESNTLNTLYIDSLDRRGFELFVQACHTRTIAMKLGWQRGLEAQSLPVCADVVFGTNVTQTAEYRQAVKEAETTALDFSRQAPAPWLPSLQRMLHLSELADVYHKIAFLCMKRRQSDWALAWFYLARDTAGLGQKYATQRFQEVNRIREKDSHDKISKDCNKSCFDSALAILEQLKRSQ